MTTITDPAIVFIWLESFVVVFLFMGNWSVLILVDVDGMCGNAGRGHVRIDIIIVGGGWPVRGGIQSEQ